MSHSSLYVTSDPFHTAVTAVALTLWGLMFGVALITITAFIWQPLRTFERRMSRSRRRARGPGHGTMPRRPRQGAADPYDPYSTRGSVTANQGHATDERSTISDVDDGSRCLVCGTPRPMDDYWLTPGLWQQSCEPACGETITTWMDGHDSGLAEVVEHCLLTSGHGGRHRSSEHDLSHWGRYDSPIGDLLVNPSPLTAHDPGDPA